MRGSSLTTFLMFLPLIAIPLLAIFGVPEFTPVNASTPADANRTGIAIDQISPKPQLGAAASRSDKAAADAFSPVHEERNAAPGFPTLKAEADPFLTNSRKEPDAARTGKQGLQGWEVNPVRVEDRRSTHRIESPAPKSPARPATSTPAGASLQSVPSTPDGSETELTWQRAVRTLNQMGIRQFVLQPGSRTDEFHFSCMYSTPDNPRVSHRFEAEDADPLRAVQKVLTQIQSRK